MDLHSIISNLHSGKRSIEQKELKTILNFNEVDIVDSNLVGDYFALKSLVNTMYNSTKTLSNSSKLKEHTRRGFILTHQGILLLLQENLVLQNISNVISKLKKPATTTSNKFLSSHKSSSKHAHSNLKNTSVNTSNTTYIENELSLASHQISSILERIQISDLLKVQISKAYNKLLEESNGTSDNSDLSKIILKPKLSFTSYNNTPNKEQKLDLKNHFLHTQASILEGVGKNFELHCLEDIFNSIKATLLEFYSEYNMQLRYDLGIIESEISLAIGFEEVFDSKVSGISSSIEYSTGHELISVIYSGFGREIYNSVNTNQNLDVFEVFKYGFKNNFNAIFKSKIAGDKSTLNQSQIRNITSLTLELEDKFTKYFKEYSPVKLYFSITNTGKIIIEDFFLEFKHLHLHKKDLTSYHIIDSSSKPILQGLGLGNSIVHGKALIVNSSSDLKKITSESIVIVKDTYPQWQHYLLKAKALIVQRGNEFSHSAQMCYEYLIPVVLQVGQFDHLISNDDLLTIDCSDMRGLVYLGLEKYKIKQLSNDEILNMQKGVSFKRKDLNKKILIHSSSKHILQKSHFPSSSQCIENAFDLIPQSLKNQISLNFESHNLDLFKKIIKEELISVISKIAISKFPSNVYINLDSFCNNLYPLFISEKEYLSLTKEEGINRTIHPSYEKVLAFIIDLIKNIKTSIGCSNICVYSTHIQEFKQLVSLKSLFKKYLFNESLGGVLGVGGILNSSELTKELSFVSCDFQEIKNVCGNKNIPAISKLIHYAAPHNSKKDSYEFGLYNVTAKDVEIIENLMIDSYSFVTCSYDEFIALYSFILFNRKNMKTKHLKFDSSNHLKK